MAPDVIPTPSGEYRIYYKAAFAQELRLATSWDAEDWTPRGTVSEPLGEVANPSIARDPDGRWWLYYSKRDEDCMQAMQPPG